VACARLVFDEQPLPFADPISFSVVI